MRDKLVRELGKIGQVKAVYLFGSRAKGTARPYSDWDICVFADKRLPKDIRTRILSLSSKNVEIVLFDELPPSMKLKVLHEGKPLFVRDELFVHRATVISVLEYLDFSRMLKKHITRVFGE